MYKLKCLYTEDLATPAKATLNYIGFYHGWIYGVKNSSAYSRKATFLAVVPGDVIGGKPTLKAKYIPNLIFEIIEV